MIAHGPQPKASTSRSKVSLKKSSTVQQNPNTKPDKSKFDPSNPNQSHESIDFLSNLEFSDNSYENKYNSLPVDICDITPQKIELDIMPPESHLSLKKIIQIMKKLQPKQQEVQEKQASIGETGIDTGIQLYQLWPGNNRFWCDGKIMAGPKTDTLTNLITWALLITVSSLFFSTAVPYLWENGNISLPVISIFLFIFSIGFLLLTSFTNPGIIPRKAIWEINGEVPYPYNGNNKRENSEILSARDLDAFEEEAKVKINKSVNLKFCKTCHIFRPPRASHCNDCGNCIEVFDHHCPFVNNCIGKRNYKYFLGFLVSLGLLGACYLSGFLIMLIASIGTDGLNTNTIAGNNTVAFVIVLILGIPTGFVFCLVVTFTGFHFWLVMKEKTTKEKLKGMAVYRDELKTNSVDWCHVEPTLFNPRQSINQEQLLKFWRYMPREQIDEL